MPYLPNTLKYVKLNYHEFTEQSCLIRYQILQPHTNMKSVLYLLSIVNVILLINNLKKIIGWL